METSWMSWKPFVVGSFGGEAGAGTFEWDWVSGQGCGADVPEWESDGWGSLWALNRDTKFGRHLAETQVFKNNDFLPNFC